MAARDRSDPGHSSGMPARYPGTFMLAFREATIGLNWKILRWLGDAVECADADGEPHTVGLENLYRRARREERSRWPDLIRDFLTRVRAAESAADPNTDLDAVADRLMLRLGQPFAGLPDTMMVWARELEGTALSINLVIDHPETMSYVTQQMVERSGRSGDDWVKRALANLRARTPDECFQPVHEESGMLLCSVADAYDSSRALLLDLLLPEAEEFGCLTALPSRDELLVLPITAEALPYLHLLKVLAEKSYKTAPYAITDEVFWVHEGVWRLFPIDLRGNNVVAQPPPEFLEVIDVLRPVEDDDQEPE